MRTLDRLKLALLTIGAMLAIASAHAEDIDLFSGSSSIGTSNVMVVVDNAANSDAQMATCSYWDGTTPSGGSKSMGNYQCALANLVHGLGTQADGSALLNLGITDMNGVKIQLTPIDDKPYTGTSFPASGSTNRQAYILAVKSLSTVPGKAGQGAEMQETWAYYTGGNGGTTGKGILSGTTYTGTSANTGCQHNYVIFLSGVNGLTANASHALDNGELPPLTASVNNAVAQGAITPAQGTAFLTAVPNKPEAGWGIEWSRFMLNLDINSGSGGVQSIVTYSIGTGATATPPAPITNDMEKYIKAMATYGGGKYFAAGTDPNALVNDLLTIFNEVQAANSVFASPGLPVGSNAQGTYLNQIFIATFRPNAADAPRWLGNLKQYQFGVDTSDPTAPPSLFLADALGNAALNSAGTGFISPNAVSFWTAKDSTQLPDSAGGFWKNLPQGVGAGYDSPDGELVEKGGVAQQIRLANLIDNYTTNPTTPRKLYTCVGACVAGTPGSSLSATPFATNNSSITAEILGTNGPAMGINSISRSGSTATVTLGVPSPALIPGQSVTMTIAGSKYPEFNGTFSVMPSTTTIFAYTVTVNPPSPAVGSSYTATVPSNPKNAALTRSGTTVTATVANHGYAGGQTVTIAHAGAGYSGSFTVNNVPAPTTNTFYYTITDGPPTPEGGGTAKVGAGAPLTIPAGGIVRNASNASNVSEVTVTLSVNVPFAVGNGVTIAGSGPSLSYNGLWTITKLGTSCAGGTKSGSNPRSFCFNINTTPVSPAVADPGFSITADGGSSPLAISGLTHATSTCGSNSTVLVTATTNAAPTFVATETVSVGGTPGANENAYIGSFPVLSVNNTIAPYYFTYNINASPGNASNCTDSTTGMTAAAQGVTKDTLIRWVRGEDSAGDEPSPGSGITIRGSVHGDVLHSRPTVVNYGGTTGVVVFYGANDGVFRAINGNQPPKANASPLPKGACTISSSCSIGGVPPGGELWGFVPSELFPKLQRLYFDSPVVKLATTPTGIVPAPQPKDYFFDGPTSVYQDTVNNKTYIFLSARRGGRMIYALDVSDPTDPKFMWKKGCPNMTDNVGCSSGFAELGQTWSQPKIGLVHGYTNPVLIFGAGYDTHEDQNQPTIGDDTMGRGIFILDALNGNLVWRAGQGGSSNTCASNPCLVSGMNYAIPSDITLVDTNFDGYVDRLYAADTGGNIWRVDLEATSTTAGPTDPANWQVTQLASLGGAATDSPRRKFLFAPDVVVTKNFTAVLAGTGDREHPLITQSGAYGTVNRFYMIKDTKIGMNAQASPAWTPVVDNSSNTNVSWPSPAPSPQTLFDASTTAFDNASSYRGYYIVLLQNPQYITKDKSGNITAVGSKKGEQTINAPTTIGGFTYFGTNQPKPAGGNSCSTNLGNARGYKINFLTGSGGFTNFDGGGLPPSPVAGLVTVSVNGADTTLPFLLGGGGGAIDGTVGGGTSKPCLGSSADCRSSLGGGKPDIPIPPKKKRTYWYREIDR